MAESFTVNVIYKGIPKEITCTLRVSTYTYQFICLVGESELILEKDDEGKLRALDADPFSSGKPKTDPGLVRALIAEMEKILQ